MQSVKVKLTGLSPILMHSEQLSNPFDDLTKEMKKLTSKRKKTEEDLEAMAEIEWRGGLYYDKATGPYIPAMMVKASLRDGAKLSRGGKKISRAVQILKDKLPLQYVGPRTPEKLWKKKEFIDMRSVVVQRARLMRCRPIFSNWSLEVEFIYLPDQIDKADLLSYIETAGMLIGMGDFRPDKGGDFGRFSVEEI